jgi:NADH:ubiquinone oxidoreductase subunit K
MVRLSKFVLIAGVLFVIGYLNLVARPRALPEAERGDTIIRFHRAELVRQRNILRSVPLWYLFPFVPGLVLGVFAERKEGESVFGLAILAVVFALVWWLNRYGASYLDKQIQQVDALTMDASNG